MLRLLFLMMIMIMFFLYSVPWTPWKTINVSPNKKKWWRDLNKWLNVIKIKEWLLSRVFLNRGVRLICDVIWTFWIGKGRGLLRTNRVGVRMMRYLWVREREKRKREKWMDYTFALNPSNAFQINRLRLIRTSCLTYLSLSVICWHTLLVRAEIHQSLQSQFSF